MTTGTASDVYYDPYDPEIFREPYEVYRRLREEAPFYYNEAYDFYALSLFDDVERCMADRDVFLNCRGDLLEHIKQGIEAPPATLPFEDGQRHTAHRALMARVFTPKAMSDLEPQVRDYCSRILDEIVGTDHFDFVADLGARLPMRVIGMLLGIPEEDQESLRVYVDGLFEAEMGKPKDMSEGIATGEVFADYIDWRADHPSDDLMTKLICAEFEDETGTVRRLTREEVLAYVNTLAGAGNETTNRLIGWTGKLLGEHPDQRRQLVDDRSLIPNAIEEVLRCEPPNYGFARYVGSDVEVYGHTVPQGSAMLLVNGASNRDEKYFPDGDRFDINRPPKRHVTFGYGVHYCLGAHLARLEGRIALDEVLNRFPDWEVDLENAELERIMGHRGWGTLPVSVP